MKTIAKSLAIAAALAAALPLAARADGREGGRRQGDRHAPPVYGAPHHDHDGFCDHGTGPVLDHGYGRDRAWGTAPVFHPRHDWRARELRQIRSEMAALDARRAAFHARWAGRPGKLRKFDRWYLAERAELERRYARLAWTAMSWR